MQGWVLIVGEWGGGDRKIILKLISGGGGGILNGRWESGIYTKETGAIYAEKSL